MEQGSKGVSDEDLVKWCLTRFGRMNDITEEGTRYCGSIIPIKLPCKYRLEETVEVPQDPSSKTPMHLKVPDVHYRCSYGQKVVMVVDNSVLFHYIERTLIPKGYTVLTATTSEQALSDMSKFTRERKRFGDSINIILSGHDIKGKIVNGIEFLKIISEQYPSVTRVLQTSYSGRAEDAVDSGIAHLKLIKPATIQDLADTVDKAFEMHMQGKSTR